MKKKNDQEEQWMKNKHFTVKMPKKSYITAIVILTNRQKAICKKHTHAFRRFSVHKCYQGRPSQNKGTF